MWFNLGFSAVMRERLRRPGHVLRMKYDILSKIVLFGQPPKAKLKAGCPCLAREDVRKKDLRETGIPGRV